MKCRELQCGKCFITQKYKVLTHKGIDMVADINGKHATDYVVAHSDGVVVWVQKGQKHNPKASGNASYGNCVKLKHADGYYTLYAHLKSVDVKLNQKVKKGEVLGYMGNTGRSTASHLHWEVRNTKDTRINPTPYIDADLPNAKKEVYQAYDNKKDKWLPEVKIGSKDYAGNLGNAISGFRMTDLTYKAHDKVKKCWLPAVTGMSSYAGNLPNDIDAIAIKTDKLKYRVHLKNSNRWLGWVTGYNTSDSKNGYAGNIGETIDAIQIEYK